MTMLATELLTEIFHCLSRTDLEALQLVNARCYHVVEQNLSDGPVHCFDGLSVRGYNDYLLSPTRPEALCDKGIVFGSDEELMRHMRFAAVGRLRFGWTVVMDDILLESLLPLRSAWNNANCQTPRRYTCPQVLERTFSELLLCRHLSVDSKNELRLEKPFTSLAGIQHTRCLWLWKAPCHVRISEIAEWLHAETAWVKAKTLTIFEKSLGMPLAELQGLLTLLKDEFFVADKPCSYSVKLYASFAYHAVQEETLHNRLTSECLKIVPFRGSAAPPEGLLIAIVREPERSSRLSEYS